LQGFYFVSFKRLHLYQR